VTTTNYLFQLIVQKTKPPALPTGRNFFGSLALSTVGAIHFLTASVVHCLLLQLQLTNTLSKCHAVRDMASLRFTLPSVDLEESPDSLAHITASRSLDSAFITVFQKSLHLGAIR
jgi:hypothetical protein